MSKKTRKKAAKGPPKAEGVAERELSDDQLERVAGGTMDDSWIKNSFNGKYARKDGSLDGGNEPLVAAVPTPITSSKP